MPRVTVKLPVSVEVTDEQLEGAQAVNDFVGVVVKTARSPEWRDAARRVAGAIDRFRARRASR